MDPGVISGTTTAAIQNWPVVHKVLAGPQSTGNPHQQPAWCRSDAEPASADAVDTSA
jgi:hypothetical protein